MKKEITIEREYIVSFGNIKEALGIEGELHSCALWRGLSPREEDAGVSRDKETIQIITRQTNK